MPLSTSELRLRLVLRETGLRPPVKYFTDRSKAVLFFLSFMLFMSCVCHAFASVNRGPVVTWGESAGLLALVCDVYCDFVTFPFGILGKVWYLIVSAPYPCCLSYFARMILI